MAYRLPIVVLKKGATLFNTLQYTKKLIKAGVPRQHAEAQVEILAEISEGHLDTLPTKRDIKNDLRELEYRLIIKLGLITASCFSLTVAAATLIIKFF